MFNSFQDLLVGFLKATLGDNYGESPLIILELAEGQVEVPVIYGRKSTKSFAESVDESYPKISLEFSQPKPDPKNNHIQRRVAGAIDIVDDKYSTTLSFRDTNWYLMDVTFQFAGESLLHQLAFTEWCYKNYTSARLESFIKTNIEIVNEDILYDPIYYKAPESSVQSISRTDGIFESSFMLELNAMVLLEDGKQVETIESILLNIIPK